MAHNPAILQAPHAEPHVGEYSQAENNSNRKFAMWLFLGSEIMFFTVLLAAFILVRFTEHADEHSVLNVPLTSVNTFLLLMSSFLVVRALSAVQDGNQVKFQRSLALVGALGTIFLGIQMMEYSALGHEGLTLNSGQFGMAFFALTGFHGFHVFLGIVWCALVFRRAFNGEFTKDNYFGVEFFGLYWHFVDVVWIFIFTLVYLL
jgi:heme/copper-type cytochrome/quinol oxidase subunit 3